MSEPPKKKHPWEKFYAQRGVARPRAADTARPADAKPGAAPTPKPAPVPTIRPVIKPGDPAPLSPELAAAVAAALEGVGGNTNPLFVPLSQRDAVARVQRRRRQRKIALVAAGALAAIVALHFAVTRFFYRAPTAEALEEYAQALQATVLPLHSSLTQPLQLDRASVELRETLDSGQLRYVASITFRLREALYAPSNTNGTAAYRQMQESVQQARLLDAKLKLIAKVETPDPPELPLILQVSHQAREPIVVKVPFDARRYGWRWRLEPPQLGLRSVSRTLRGDVRARFANTPHLVFGASGAATEMRDRLRVARAYVIAITREAQKHAEQLAAIPDPAGAPAATRPAFDPNAPAIELPGGAPAAAAANRPAFDPNAPAIELPAAPADTSPANRPAFDPNAPAVHLPGAKPAAATAPAIDPNAPAIQLRVRKQPPAPPRGK